MKNPWLDIPLGDYEAHMALPAVGQAPLLADALERAVIDYAPRSVALLGCAGGNGLDRPAVTGVRRVVAVDINPDFIESTRLRFAGRLPGLELFAGDVQSDTLVFEPVDLAFAGLLFEYVDVARTLERIAALLRPGGVLIAVLQLPYAAAAVTPSAYTSLGALAAVLRLVPPERFVALAGEGGFRAGNARVVRASGGKEFHVQELHRPPLSSPRREPRAPVRARR